MKHLCFKNSGKSINAKHALSFMINTIFFISLLFLMSCNEETTPPPFVKPTKGYYILNSGSYGSNNATLIYYDNATQTTTPDVFETQNGKKMGDTGNDIIIYGSKMYITATGSNVIYITTKEGKIIETIQPLKDNKPEEPRYLAAEGKYVYVTLYSGYVARIDTTTNAIDKKVAVGIRPEGLAISNGKIYVTISGDFSTKYAEEVAIVDINNFTKLQDITVTMNPTSITPSGYGPLYLISSGNYDNIKSTLQTITNNGTPEVKIIDKATEMVVCNNILYTIYGEYGNNNIQYISYNAQTGNLISTQYKPESLTIEKPYKLSADPQNNRLIITTSDYFNNGDVYILSATDLSIIATFDSQGINPIKVIPL